VLFHQAGLCWSSAPPRLHIPRSSAKPRLTRWAGDQPGGSSPFTWCAHEETCAGTSNSGLQGYRAKAVYQQDRAVPAAVPTKTLNLPFFLRKFSQFLLDKHPIEYSNPYLMLPFN